MIKIKYERMNANQIMIFHFITTQNIHNALIMRKFRERLINVYEFMICTHETSVIDFKGISHLMQKKNWNNFLGPQK